MTELLAHERLAVYAKALQFAAGGAALASVWKKKHAVVDQFLRAAESIVLNLAEAARLRTFGRLTTIDYAIGSSLECAACFDIARIKRLLDDAECQKEKGRLCEITKMLIGLRKAWAEPMAREEAEPFGRKSQQPLFHHENLHVYRAALSFVEWFESWRAGMALRTVRHLDEWSTSIVLNIAEGNGRYAELDNHRFLEMAQSAAVKTAAYLDLHSYEAGRRSEVDITNGKQILREIVAMLRAM